MIIYVFVCDYCIICIVCALKLLITKKDGCCIFATTDMIDERSIKANIRRIREEMGLTQEAIDHADGYVKIPMYGFTESFNISVCAALSLFCLTERMRADSRLNWQLSNEEQTTLKLYWAMQVIHDGERVMRHLMSEVRSKN